MGTKGRDVLVGRARVVVDGSNQRGPGSAARAGRILGLAEIARRLADGERDRPSALAAAFADVEADYRRRAESALLAALERLPEHAERKGRGWVIDSFWSAWDAFAGHETYRDAVIATVKYGNDTDTTAAIAGGLAGIYWGLDESAGGIPAAWLNGLRDSDQVERILCG